MLIGQDCCCVYRVLYLWQQQGSHGSKQLLHCLCAQSVSLCAQSGVSWFVCTEWCVLVCVHRVVCLGLCAQSGVSWFVCTGWCVLVCVHRVVCLGLCAQSGVSWFV